MVGRVDLPAWPTTVDCVSWSKDNWIAVACGEDVAILTPRLVAPGPRGELWHSTSFKANAFTTQEVPLSDPLSFENFSIGEELSHRHVHALQWSSPRLGRFGSCVLAVLNSNHVLSLWECDGNPTVSSDWKRRVVVNHAIRDFHANRIRPVGEPEEPTDVQRESAQVRQRIKAFCWSPPVYQDWSDGYFGMRDSQLLPYVDYGYQWLAVSTEDESVFAIAVQPPDILDPSATEWRAEVVNHRNAGDFAFEGLYRGLSDEEIDSHPLNDDFFIANHLAWSAWHKPEGRVEDFGDLAFISKGRLFCMTVAGNAWQRVHEIENPNHADGRQLIPSRTDLTGPLKFIPNTTLLICFGTDAAFCVDTSLDPSDPASYTSHHLDSRWDEVTGVAASAEELGRHHVHITSHLSTAIAATAKLSLPLNGKMTAELPRWKQAILDSKANFSSEHGLGGKVQERTWGIAASPFGDFTATATSMHPADAVAYIIHSEENTVLNITHNERKDDTTVLPARTSSFPSLITTEVILFGIQRYLRRHPKDTDRRKIADDIIQTIAVPKEHWYFEPGDKSNFGGMSNPPVVRQYLRMQLFLHPEMLRQRFEMIVDIAFSKVSDSIGSCRWVVERLVREILSLPKERKFGGSLTRSILGLYGALGSMLELEIAGAVDQQNSEWHEDCAVCHEAVPLQSIHWAKCAAGHRFSRCALTFRAIQSPGVSKYCSLCGAQFLNERSLPEFGAGPDRRNIEMRDLSVELQNQDQAITDSQTGGAHVSSVARLEQGHKTPVDSGWVHVSQSEEVELEPSQSLARLMFAAFDVCVYCGSKYVV